MTRPRVNPAASAIHSLSSRDFSALNAEMASPAPGATIERPKPGMKTELSDADSKILEQLVDATLDAFRSGRIERSEARTVLMRTIVFVASGNAYVDNFAEKVISEIL